MTHKEIIDLNADDIAGYTLFDVDQRSWGIMLKINGKCAGIGGVVYHNDEPVAFMELTSLGESRPLQPAKMTKVLLNMIKERGHKKIITLCGDDKYPLAYRFLIMLGFKDTGRVISGRKVFECQV